MNFLKEHESHELHESGKQVLRELAIIICGFLTRIIVNCHEFLKEHESHESHESAEEKFA